MTDGQKKRCIDDLCMVEQYIDVLADKLRYEAGASDSSRRFAAHQLDKKTAAFGSGCGNAETEESIAMSKTPTTPDLTLPDMLDEVLENQVNLLWAIRFSNVRDKDDNRRLERSIYQSRDFLKQRQKTENLP
jgi:hypothetical protein